MKSSEVQVGKIYKVKGVLRGRAKILDGPHKRTYTNVYYFNIESLTDDPEEQPWRGRAEAREIEHEWTAEDERRRIAGRISAEERAERLRELVARFARVGVDVEREAPELGSYTQPVRIDIGVRRDNAEQPPVEHVVLQLRGPVVIEVLEALEAAKAR